MLKILTSLTFLYALAIIVLLLYGFLYYRNFEKSRYQRRQISCRFFYYQCRLFFFSVDQYTCATGIKNIQ